MRIVMPLMMTSAFVLTACAGQTPEQVARYDDAMVAHTDGYLTGSRIRQDISQYDPALMVIGPSKVNGAPDNQVSSALAYSAAYPFLQFSKGR